jgi:hypothetical protein
MFCQRGKVATLVPPNFITIQGALAGRGAEVGEVTGIRYGRWDIQPVLRRRIEIANGFSIRSFGRLDV